MLFTFSLPIRKYALMGLAFALVSTAAVAGAITVWNNNQTVTAAQLNGNFSHIHNTMVGGHGARLVDADVSSTAAIQHSKLLTPALVPKAWALVASGCDGAMTNACTILASSGITSVVGTGGAAGRYNVTLTTNPPTTSFAAIVSPSGTALAACLPGTRSITAPHLEVRCFDGAGAAVNTGFQLVFMTL